MPGDLDRLRFASRAAAPRMAGSPQVDADIGWAGQCRRGVCSRHQQFLEQAVSGLGRGAELQAGRFWRMWPGGAVDHLAQLAPLDSPSRTGCPPSRQACWAQVEILLVLYLVWLNWCAPFSLALQCKCSCLQRGHTGSSGLLACPRVAPFIVFCPTTNDFAHSRVVPDRPALQTCISTRSAAQMR